MKIKLLTILLLLQISAQASILRKTTKTLDLSRIPSSHIITTDKQLKPKNACQYTVYVYERGLYLLANSGNTPKSAPEATVMEVVSSVSSGNPNTGTSIAKTTPIVVPLVDPAKNEGVFLLNAEELNLGVISYPHDSGVYDSILDYDPVLVYDNGNKSELTVLSEEVLMVRDIKEGSEYNSNSVITIGEEEAHLRMIKESFLFLDHPKKRQTQREYTKQRIEKIKETTEDKCVRYPITFPSYAGGLLTYLKETIKK